MPDVTKSPIKLVILDGVGYALFAVGAFYSLASHTLHERLPFLTGLEHSTQIFLGAGVAVAGIITVVISDKLKKRRARSGS